MNCMLLIPQSRWKLFVSVLYCNVQGRILGIQEKGAEEIMARAQVSRKFETGGLEKRLS